MKVGWVQRGIWQPFHQIWSLVHQNHPVELLPEQLSSLDGPTLTGQREQPGSKGWP